MLWDQLEFLEKHLGATVLRIQYLTFIISVWIISSEGEGCCVFRPANRCFSFCLLVEIIIFSVKTSSSVFFRYKRKKEKKVQK